MYSTYPTLSKAGISMRLIPWRSTARISSKLTSSMPRLSMIITHRICYPRSILKDVYCHRGRNMSRLFPKLGKREESKRSTQDYNEIKPTVSLSVTYAVACTYGCNDGRIAPTRYAIIDAGFGDR